MHLSSITLTNVRQFDHRTFDFQPGFNLIVGENGTGKTTILRGLVAALGRAGQNGRSPWLEDDDIRLRSRYAKVRAVAESLSDHTRVFSIKKSLWGRSVRSPHINERPLVLYYGSNEATCQGMKLKHAKRSRISAGGKEYRDDEEFFYLRMNMEDSLRQRQPSAEPRFGNSRSVKRFIGDILYTFDQDFNDFFWSFEPYDCSLVLPSGKLSKLVFDEKLDELARAAAMRYFKEEIPKFRKRPYVWPDNDRVILYPRDAAQRGDKDNLPDLLEMWSNVKLEITPKARELLLGMPLEVKLTPRIMINHQHGFLRLSQLSDGQQRIFSLFVDIARQLLLQNPQDQIGDGEAIVLIDEIDVHLHPKWQRMIVPALEDIFPNCQFIATTHSPFIVQSTPRGSVQSIEGNPIGDVTDRGIEEVAKKALDVDGDVGARYEEELKAAKDYLKAVYAAEPSDSSEVKVLRKKLHSLGSRYARNPAYQAFLELRTDAQFGSEE